MKNIRSNREDFNVSGVIITHNSEKFIGEAIKSLNWCNEVVVIDDVSDDKTKEVSKRLGAKVFSRKMNGDFAAQRNYAYKVSKSDWVFFVDDDERSTPELQREIQTRLEEDRGKNINLYFMRRKDYFLGKFLAHGPAGEAYFPRLVLKNKSYWTDKIFEQLHVQGESCYLQERMIHDRQESVEELVIKANYYSSLEADMLFRKGVKPRVGQIIWDPTTRFWKYYIWQKAFLDGVPGLIFVILGSVLVKQLTEIKLWIKWMDKK